MFDNSGHFFQEGIVLKCQNQSQKSFHVRLSALSIHVVFLCSSVCILLLDELSLKTFAATVQTFCESSIASKCSQISLWRLWWRGSIWSDPQTCFESLTGKSSKRFQLFSCAMRAPILWDQCASRRAQIQILILNF